MTWTGIDYYTGTNYPNEKTEKWGEGTYSYGTNYPNEKTEKWGEGTYSYDSSKKVNLIITFLNQTLWKS